MLLNSSTAIKYNGNSMQISMLIQEQTQSSKKVIFSANTLTKENLIFTVMTTLVVTHLVL